MCEEITWDRCHKCGEWTVFEVLQHYNDYDIIQCFNCGATYPHFIDINAHF